MPVATSADCTYALDTVNDWPRALKTEADLTSLPTAVYRAGDSLTVTAPDGTSSTTTKIADSMESLPINAGGLWTFSNDRQKGTVSFTVRHSIYGTLGDGSEISPAKLMDSEELADLVVGGIAGDGYFFSLDSDSLIASLQLPGGYCLTELPNGLFRMNESEDGCRYVCADVGYPIDAKQSGSGRRIYQQDVLPVAYSGDSWRRDPVKTSTLTIVDPDGVENDPYELAGTGVKSIPFNKLGVWRLRLDMENGKFCEASVNICKKFFSVIIR
jgi:hypothetical protein